MTRLHWSQQTIVAALTAVLFVFSALFVPGFLTGANLLGLVQAQATLGLLSLGMAVVVISRGIDLSMVSTVTVPPAIVLSMVQMGWSPVIALLVGLMFSVGFGLLNGWLIAYVGLSAIFATLATGLMIGGIGVGIFNFDVVVWPADLNGMSWIGRSAFLGVPMPLLAFLIALVAVFIFLDRTRLGRFVYAMGDNLDAARSVGIPSRRVTLLLYVLSSLIAFATGLIMAAMLNSMSLRSSSASVIYDIVLVVVVGGIGLSGGRGGASSVLVGTLLIGTFVNMMTLLDASYSIQSLIKGLLLLSAIILDSRLNPQNEETAQQGDI